MPARYEASHRARRTILDKINELRGEEPWSGYDEMTVGEILPRISELTPDDLDALEAYESRHKNRRTVHDAVRRARGHASRT